MISIVLYTKALISFAINVWINYSHESVLCLTIPTLPSIYLTFLFQVLLKESRFLEVLATGLNNYCTEHQGECCQMLSNNNNYRYSFFFFVTFSSGCGRKRLSILDLVRALSQLPLFHEDFVTTSLGFKLGRSIVGYFNWCITHNFCLNNFWPVKVSHSTINVCQWFLL